MYLYLHMQVVGFIENDLHIKCFFTEILNLQLHLVHTVLFPPLTRTSNAFKTQETQARN